MSPETDLLERLTGEDASLYETAYGSCYAFRDIAHAQQVVKLYVRSAIVELYDDTDPDKSAIPYHDARWIVDDDENWCRSTRYYLRLTKDGYAKFVEDSAGFFDRLFSDHE